MSRWSATWWTWLHKMENETAFVVGCVAVGARNKKYNILLSNTRLSLFLV